ncbi:AraC family transcriptional regulator [Aeromicrobium sp. NPDC092404]|uniref:helix-turn-helix transcriptional regulator n=1 Tax=Aeromicrobium sp. NPDC092404 TaxID=3154976 RepID=UPI0034271FDC
MTAGERVSAWRPAVPGVGEVLHAHFTAHAYPAHTHAFWTVLLVDTGGVSYELERIPHDAPPRSLTLLPPHVPHDGRAAVATGFDKRVVYLDERWLPLELTGAAVRSPTLRDDQLVRAVGRLHQVLASPGDELEAESQLAVVSERMAQHLDRSMEPRRRRAEPALARRVRDLLDHDLTDVPTLESLAAELDAHPTQLIRAFGREYGLPPHRYVTGRRVDRARGLLLDRVPPAEVAAVVGFYDQAHLTRHFRATLGVTPGAYARQAA